MKITLTILEEDIRKNNYGNSEDCPITRAYARAGHPELRDTGLGNTKWEYTQEQSEALLAPLFGMYNYINPKESYRFNGITPPDLLPADYTVTLEFPDFH